MVVRELKKLVQESFFCEGQAPELGLIGAFDVGSSFALADDVLGARLPIRVERVALLLALCRVRGIVRRGELPCAMPMPPTDKVTTTATIGATLRCIRFRIMCIPARLVATIRPCNRAAGARLHPPGPARRRFVVLSALRGETVVLYFYPRADTPGCTTQACGIRDRDVDNEATSRGCRRLPGAVAVKFVAKYELGSACSPTPPRRRRVYGAWGEKMIYGKKSIGVNRSTVVIDAEGKVAGSSPRSHPRRTTRWCSRPSAPSWARKPGG